MAELKYIFTAEMNITAGGYSGEWKGVTPTATRQESSSPTGEQTYEYYYTDSNSGDNNNSSRVTIKLKDSWTITQNSDNSLDVTMTTTVLSLRRDNIHGNPNAGGNYGRNILVQAGKGGPTIANISNDPINTSHSLSFNAGPFTTHFTVPAGGSEWRSPVYVHNHTPGFPVAVPYLDEMYCGTTIYNPNQKGFGHCIEYDANGGRDAPSGYCWTDEEECSTIQISSQRPWSPHWVFLGWSTNPNATSASYQPGQSITVCEAVTLYAIYRYTYRPGMVRIGGTFYSCDRDGASGPLGRCNVRRGNKWVEMRIDPIHTGLDDPPCIERGGRWVIQQLIGADGTPHHIKWDCPHEWN